MHISFLSCLFSINLSLQLSHICPFSLANYAFFEYIENVWDVLCTKHFSRIHFLCSLAWSHVYEPPAYKEKNICGHVWPLSFQANCICFYLDIFRLCASIYALASCGHISNFNVLISSLQIFSLHQVIKSKDLGIQKRTGFTKAHFEMNLFSVFSSL